MKKYRATVLMGGCAHPGGHRVRLYSTETDEAWWIAEAICQALGVAGLHTAVNFQSRETENEPWLDGLPDYPPGLPL